MFPAKLTIFHTVSPSLSKDFFCLYKNVHSIQIEIEIFITANTSNIVRVVNSSVSLNGTFPSNESLLLHIDVACQSDFLQQIGHTFCIFAHNSSDLEPHPSFSGEHIRSLALTNKTFLTAGSCFDSKRIEIAARYASKD